jgi:hypothetical protein
VELFETRVVGPWIELVGSAARTKFRIDFARNNPQNNVAPVNLNALDAEATKLLRSERSSLQTSSWYILLDFALLLEKHLSNVWKHLSGQQGATTPTDAEQQLLVALNAIQLPQGSALHNTLSSEYPGKTIANTLAAALVAVRGREQDLEKVDSRYDPTLPGTSSLWPNLLFPLADPAHPAPSPQILVNPAPTDPVDLATARLFALGELVAAAMPGPPIPADGESVLRPQTKFDPREGWFHIRCVYDRPACGPFDRPAVSHPTAPFQLASYFDPEAPARPIRIPMPLDISPAGLR